MKFTVAHENLQWYGMQNRLWNIVKNNSLYLYFANSLNLYFSFKIQSHRLHFNLSNLVFQLCRFSYALILSFWRQIACILNLKKKIITDLKVFSLIKTQKYKFY